MILPSVWANALPDNAMEVKYKYVEFARLVELTQEVVSDEETTEEEEGIHAEVTVEQSLAE